MDSTGTEEKDPLWNALFEFVKEFEMMLLSLPQGSKWNRNKILYYHMSPYFQPPYTYMQGKNSWFVPPLRKFWACNIMYTYLGKTKIMPIWLYNTFDLSKCL